VDLYGEVRNVSTQEHKRKVELVYGEGGEGLVFLEKEYALNIAGFRKALYEVPTWGELKARVNEARYRETVERWAEGEFDRLLDEGELEGDGEPDVSLPSPNDAFHADSLPGYADSDWPEFAPMTMNAWVDEEIIKEYGWYVQPTLNEDYPVIDSRNEERVVSLLEERGYICICDDDLVWKAIWGI
jgi:hypothetical protein